MGSDVYSWFFSMDNNTDIEVTSAMVQAGFQVLARSGIADDFLEADKLLVADIYRAMQRAAVSSLSIHVEASSEREP